MLLCPNYSNDEIEEKLIKNLDKNIKKKIQIKIWQRLVYLNLYRWINKCKNSILVSGIEFGLGL